MDATRRSRRLRTPEAAEYCALAPSALEKLRLTAGGPYFSKIGRAVVYSISYIDDWLAQKQRRSTNDPRTAIEISTDPEENARQAYGVRMRQGAKSLAPPAATEVRSRCGHDSTMLLVDVAASCPEGKNRTWKQVVSAVVERYGFGEASHRFTNVVFDGEVAWVQGKFALEQLANRFVVELGEIQVWAGKPPNEQLSALSNDGSGRM